MILTFIFTVLSTNLRKFERVQILMTRRQGSSISETARPVICSCSADLSIYAKVDKCCETSSRRQGIGRPSVIKENGHRKLSRMVKQN